jgi:hypothetical protein
VQADVERIYRTNVFGLLNGTVGKIREFAAERNHQQPADPQDWVP